MWSISFTAQLLFPKVQDSRGSSSVQFVQDTLEDYPLPSERPKRSCDGFSGRYHVPTQNVRVNVKDITQSHLSQEEQQT